jgi:hypothetical protein
MDCEEVDYSTERKDFFCEGGLPSGILQLAGRPANQSLNELFPYAGTHKGMKKDSYEKGQRYLSQLS